MQNLILIGFMGAGKTSVGNCLAQESGMTFVDTDERIVAEQGMEISAIFEKYGEPYFRDLETALLERMQNDTDHSVISVGGGMPVRERNRDLLRSLGCVVYLLASKETILGRVRNDGTRPMLSGENLETRVERLMREREALYREAAHLMIQTDGYSVPEVAQMIRLEARKFGY
ncbi:MAG: shikimate kinase [Lachnospiraceae bacterium]|nr:shikimate kinase [Lachnospiraceae bacterium]